MTLITVEALIVAQRPLMRQCIGRKLLQESLMSGRPIVAKNSLEAT